LKVFNSAGEVVAVLVSGLPVWNEAAGGLIAGTLDPDTGPPVAVASYPGLPPVTWNGLNSSGQMVSGGSYQLQASIADQWGNVTVYAVTLQVIRTPQGVDIDVFNSAGEQVRDLSTAGSPAGAQFQLSSGVLVEGSSSGAVKLGLADGSTLAWDGTNDQGRLVAPGIYYVQALQWIAPGQALQLESKAVQVLAGKRVNPLAQAIVGPQPCPTGQTLSLRWPPVPGARLVWRFYQLDGEMAAQGDLDAGLGRAALPTGAAADGIYLLDLDLVDPGSVPQHRLFKVAVAP